MQGRPTEKNSPRVNAPGYNGAKAASSRRTPNGTARHPCKGGLQKQAGALGEAALRFGPVNPVHPVKGNRSRIGGGADVGRGCIPGGIGREQPATRARAAYKEKNSPRVNAPGYNKAKGRAAALQMNSPATTF